MDSNQEDFNDTFSADIGPSYVPQFDFKGKLEMKSLEDSSKCHKTTQTLPQDWVFNIEDCKVQCTLLGQENLNEIRVCLPTEIEIGKQTIDSSLNLSAEDLTLVPRNYRWRPSEVKTLLHGIVDTQRSDSPQQHINIITDEPSPPIQHIRNGFNKLENCPHMSDEYSLRHQSSMFEIHVVPDNHKSWEYSIPSNKIVFYDKRNKYSKQQLQGKRPLELLDENNPVKYINSIFEETNYGSLKDQLTILSDSKTYSLKNVKSLLSLVLSIGVTATVTSFIWYFSLLI